MRGQVDNISASLMDIDNKAMQAMQSMKELRLSIKSFNEKYDKTDIIKHLYNNGASISEIARKLDVSYSTMYYRLRSLKQSGELKERGRGDN